MYVRYFAKNVEIPDTIREHIEKRMTKVEKIFDRILDAQVTLTCLRGIYVAEVTVDLNGLVVRGEDRSDDMRHAFDMALKNIERQVRRHKEYLLDKVKLKGREVSFGMEDFTSREAKQEESPDEREILKKKRFAVRAMTAAEATMQMDLLGHDFFVFKNPDSGDINIVYRRRKGGYGLLEPE